MGMGFIAQLFTTTSKFQYQWSLGADHLGHGADRLVHNEDFSHL